MLYNYESNVFINMMACSVSAEMKCELNRVLKESFTETDLLETNVVRLSIEELKNVFLSGMIPSKRHIENVVTALCDFLTSESTECDTSTGPLSTLDPSNCPICRFVLVDPVTLPCGHSCCNRCVTPAEDETSFKCLKCLSIIIKEILVDYKTNIVIANLCDKWWSEQIIKSRERNEVLYMLQKNETENVSDQTSDDSGLQIIELVNFEDRDNVADDYDPTRLSLLSQYLCLQGNIEEAKRFANLCVQTIPDSFLGYLRLAEVYEQERKIEASAVQYFRSFLRSHDDGTKKKIKKSIVNILGILFSCDQSVPHSKDVMLADSTSNSYYHNDNDLNNVDIDKFISLMDRCVNVCEEVNSLKPSQPARFINLQSVDVTDFECSVCSRVYWEPVTTPCGHTFCLQCLNRTFDYTANCPLCKQSLQEFLPAEKKITEFIDVMIERHFSAVYQERRVSHDQELIDFTKGIEDGSCVPLFICTVAFPNLPCPLHIFEPRYKLLIRRCRRSNCMKFGMSMRIDSSSEIEFGCLLQINDVETTYDGRLILKTVGSRRFKILECHLKDGYNVVSVEWISDIPPNEIESQDVARLQNVVHREAEDWFGGLTESMKNRIRQYLGEMPPVQENFLSESNGPSWLWWIISIMPLSPRMQITLLGTQSLKQRLQIVSRAIQMIKENPPAGLASL